MLGPHTHRDNPLSRIMCDPRLAPIAARPRHGVSHCENSTTSLFFFKKKSTPRAKMVKRNDKTNTGEGVEGKKGRTVSDDPGGKSLSDTSTSAGVKSTTIHTSVNIFEVSKRDKPQYFIDKVKEGMLNQECKTRWSSTQLWIIFDEGPGNHSTVLCTRKNDGC